MDFAPYSGQSVADFAYDDSEGALTRLLFGADRMESWRDRWPKYYLEVKASSGSADLPFHVSAQQLSAVRVSFTLNSLNLIVIS